MLPVFSGILNPAAPTFFPEAAPPRFLDDPYSTVAMSSSSTSFLFSGSLEALVKSGFLCLMGGGES